MRPSLNILIIASLGLAGLTCDKGTDPPPYVRSIELNAEDASCTEAWLRVRITDGSAPPFDIVLYRDSQAVQTLQLSTPDSLLIDEDLLPNRTYTYKAYRLAAALLTDSTTLQSVTTMDTSSSNWVFDPPVLLGDGSSSVLYDVAIINDTLAYAVGAVYLAGDPQAYNMARWDGSTWELMRIRFFTICGQSGTTPYPAKAIFAFSANDIWITSQGGQVARWDGTTQTATICMPDPFVVNKIWGENPSSVYFVGNSGRIAHFSNGTWRRLESGTGLAMRDIWGARNPRTGELEILALASTFTPQLQGSMVFKISRNSATPISTTGMSPEMHSIWFASGQRYYAVGAGIHQKRMLTDSAWVAYPPGVVTHYYSDRVRGQGSNEVFVVGDFGEIVHYNGKTWTRYFDGMFLPSGVLGGLSIKGNVMMAVGFTSVGINTKGIIVTGRR